MTDIITKKAIFKRGYLYGNQEYWTDKDWKDHAKHVKELKEKGEYGEEVEITMSMVNNPLFDEPSKQDKATTSLSYILMDLGAGD